MSEKKDLGGFRMILDKFAENITNPFVWVPLGFFVLSIIAYERTDYQAFIYLAIGFFAIAFVAECYWRWRNRRTPRKPDPQHPGYMDNVKAYLTQVQAKAVSLLENGKTNAAMALTRKNLDFIEEALSKSPEDSDFLTLLGYTLKDLYQGSRRQLPQDIRRKYLIKARRAVESALRIDPDNPSTHNVMGNILFFEGKFEQAINEHDKAIHLADLAGIDYHAAKGDKRLVSRVMNGEIQFDF